MTSPGRSPRSLAVLGLAVLALVLGGIAMHWPTRESPPSDSPVAAPSGPDGGVEHDRRQGSASGHGPWGLPAPEDARAAAGRDTDSTEVRGSATTRVAEPPAEPVAAPVRIEIPAIGVDARVVPVGLLPDGAMEVPDFGLAGWYTEGPRPGEEGPAAVVAHVDSRDGPDVFFRLHELEAGDEVRVHTDEGSSVAFEVEHQEQTPKDELPTDRIWGWTEEPTLRLLTCDGFFDRASGHYIDNRIVYLSRSSADPD